HRLSLAALINQHPAQTESSSAALLEALLNQSAGSSKDFRRQFTAVFTGHHTFDVFQHCGPHSAVVFKLLGAKMHRNTGPAADPFVMSTFISVQKPSPPAHIINKDIGEIG